jgi:hypothetical protein
MSIETKFLKVTMPDRSKWKIPVRVIAEHRARYYFEEKKEFESLEASLKEDTLPLFEEDEYEVEDWASNNMDWEDVVKYAERIKDGGLSAEDLREGWINGEKEIIEE